MILRISGRLRSTSNARKPSSSSSRRATSAPRRCPSPPARYSPRSTERLTSRPPAPQNCLREVRSSLEMNKPLILVQEMDPAKGGGTLAVLRAECPEGLQPAIFDQDRPHTAWMRIKEFQRVSLKLIAEATPGRGGSADPLCPGDRLRLC